MAGLFSFYFLAEEENLFFGHFYFTKKQNPFSVGLYWWSHRLWNCKYCYYTL